MYIYSYVPDIVFYVYMFIYDAVNPHKDTRIEGETWKYGYFKPW